MKKIIDIFHRKPYYFANAFYQGALLLSQFILIVSIFIQEGSKGLDTFFLYLAIVLPYHTFLQLGLKQLRLSLVISSNVIFKIRLVAILFFFILLYFFVDIDSYLIYTVLFLKVSDFLFDIIIIEYQINKNVKKVLYLSVFRIVLFLLFAINLKLEMLGFILFISPVFLLFVVRYTALKKHVNSLKGIKLPVFNMFYIGVTGCISSLIISYPRIILGESSVVGDGVLSSVSLVSYLGLIGGLVISSFLPSVVPKLTLLDASEAQKKLKKYSLKVIYISSCFVGFAYLLLMVFLYALKFELYVYILFLFMFLSIILNLTISFIEYFSSIDGREHLIMLTTCFVLMFSYIASNMLAWKWGGVGYSLVIFSSYAIRLALSYCCVIFKHTSRV